MDSYLRLENRMVSDPIRSFGLRMTPLTLLLGFVMHKKGFLLPQQRKYPFKQTVISENVSEEQKVGLPVPDRRATWPTT